MPVVLGSISGVAHPTRRLRRLMDLAGGTKLDHVEQVVEEVTAIDGLASLLTEAMAKCQASDGRVDMREVAAFCLRRMVKNQK